MFKHVTRDAIRMANLLLSVSLFPASPPQLLCSFHNFLLLNIVHILHIVCNLQVFTCIAEKYDGCKAFGTFQDCSRKPSGNTMYDRFDVVLP